MSSSPIYSIRALYHFHNMANAIIRPPSHLYHYINKAGYGSIIASQKPRASTITGVRNTHYGKGVYFASIIPLDIPILGTYNSIEHIFGSVSVYAVEHMAYYVEIEVDPEWYVADAFDPKHGVVQDIWLAPDWAGEDGELSIQGRIYTHGKTTIGYDLDCIEDQTRAANDYAYCLAQKRSYEVHM
ncbi:hypothetical protein BU16DRAFT_601105 [Lophium mytilinum]|uniref:Tox-ART-HYD1 domain-containing protein n=1 Tax=Lophium mytilinum TaxID=390894 RepID=A0A6A6Q7Z4_9PEZI|nr:hypothetical protein BU16DRAFT_601105 [Lophium mytilinum]